MSDSKSGSRAGNGASGGSAGSDHAHVELGRRHVAILHARADSRHERPGYVTARIWTMTTWVMMVTKANGMRLVSRPSSDAFNPHWQALKLIGDRGARPATFVEELCAHDRRPT